MNLQTYFEEAVAAGWAPRHPANESELHALEASITRGTCIEPLVYGDDVVYIDRSMKPEPGDLVSFALSQRAADVQNTPPLLPDHRPRSKGDRWIKLYAPYHGIEMLFDKYGGSTSATWMTCESPDDVPVLYPVRNIRRGGRLLFGAADAIPIVSRRAMLFAGLAAPLALSGCRVDGVDVPELPAASEPGDAPQIAPNAITVFTQATTASTAIANSSTFTPVVQVTIGPYPLAVEIVATFTGGYAFTTASNPDVVLSQGLLTDTSTSVDTTILRIPSNQTAGTTSAGSFSISEQFTLAAGATKTYYGQVNGTWIQAASSLTISGAMLSLQSVKR